MLLVSAQEISDYYEKSKLEPEAELLSSLQNMAAVSSYRYKLESTFTVENRREVISEVVGEKNSDNTHIKGEMVNTPVDIYYLDSTIYNYDSFSKKWLVIESNTSNSEELLISELNPLSNFKFKNIHAVQKLDFEKIDGTECLVVSCNPSIESQLLETLWKDFKYQFWIDYKKDLIKKASLTAINKQNGKTRLDIKVSFRDINKNIKIEPPEISPGNKNN